MRLISVVLFEDYKSAKTKFVKQIDDTDLVALYLDVHKTLKTQKRLKGKEADIGYWEKKNFSDLKDKIDFILNIAKPEKQKLDLVNNEKWEIIVPLNHEAGVKLGSGADWCTSKENQTHFSDYFFDQDALIIYCLPKKSNLKWAILEYPDGQTQMWDYNNDEITEEMFNEQTGLNLEEISWLADSKAKEINKYRHEGKKNDLTQIVKRCIHSDLPSRDVEELIKNKKNVNLAYRYWEKFNRLIEVPDRNIAFEMIQGMFLHSEKDVIPEEWKSEGVKNELSDIFSKLSATKQARAYLALPKEYKTKELKDSINYDSYCESVKEEPSLLAHVPEDFIDYDMCKLAIAESAYCIKFVPSTLMGYRDLCMYAVKKDSSALCNIKHENQYYELCKTAITNEIESFNYVSPAINNYAELAITAISKIPDFLQRIPEHFRTTDMCLTAIYRKPKMLKFVPTDKKTLQLCYTAVKLDRSTISLVPEKYHIRILTELNKESKQ